MCIKGENVNKANVNFIFVILLICKHFEVSLNTLPTLRILVCFMIVI